MIAVPQKLSALVVVHNEESRLTSCLELLLFADEIVVVLDRCTDRSEEIAQAYGARLVKGAWPIEGERRNAGLATCSGDWILEVDADEHIPPTLAEEIRQTLQTSSYDRHLIPIDNYIGARLVRYGWGSSFGTSGRYSLFRRGYKTWGMQRVHPALTWRGCPGIALKTPMRHYVDRSISDMIQRLDRYTAARAQDLRESGRPGSWLNVLRSSLSRFCRVYIGRRGYREGRLGLVIAVCTALYPLLSYVKAVDEEGLSS